MSNLNMAKLMIHNAVLSAPVTNNEIQLQSRKARTAANVLACAAIPLLTVASVAADNPAPANNLEDTLKKLSGIIFFIFKAIGFIMSCWGIGQLVLAFKDEDANGKQRAIMLVIAGFLMFSLETVFDTLGIKAPSLDLNAGNNTPNP